jgi:hypothetical protein
MKNIAIEVDELLDILGDPRVSLAEVGDELHDAGWRSPTEVSVALKALREGDLPRAAIILQGHGDANPVSTEEPS